jgi:hypothetical protein
MILRNYMGRTKTVGRTQVSSQILMSALKRINEEFSILREAKREVLEDVMDIENTKNVLNGILKENIRIAQIQTTLPSPFGFNIALQGHLDVLKIEDKYEFLKRMHEQILAKLGMEKPKVEEYPHDPYNEIWQKEEETLKTKEMDKNMQLVTDAQKAARRLKLPRDYLDNIIEMIHGERKGLRTDFILWLDGTFKKAIPKAISDPLAKFLIKAKEEIR